MYIYNKYNKIDVSIIIINKANATTLMEKQKKMYDSKNSLNGM